MGLVSEVAESEDIVACAERWAAEILECGPLAVQAAKQVAIHTLETSVMLAQTQLEKLLALAWTETNRPTQLSAPLGDSTTTADPYADLAHPSSISEVNAANLTDDTLGEPVYRVSWSVEEMDTEPTWLRLRVRCAFYDKRFATYRGTTISSFRYRDD